MTHLGSLIKSFDPMPIAECLKQPAPVWREVESICLELKHFTCKEVAGESIHQPGWLRAWQFEPLLALDVPVTRAFAAVSFKYRLALRQMGQGRS